MKFSRSLYAKVAVAALVLAAAGTASVAQARSDVYFSVGAHVAPGLNIGVSNAPVYYPPVYVQPAPVYYAPPVYVRPAPVYYGAPGYYVRPAPVYYGAPAYYSGGHWKHNKHNKHWKHSSHRHGHGHR